MADSVFDRLWLTVCMKLLSCYVIPKTTLQSYVAQWIGSPRPTLDHRVANATISWLASSLSVSHFRALTTSTASPATLLQHCPTLLKSGAICTHVHSDKFKAWYVPKIPSSNHIILYVHGGGFVSGSPESASPYLLQLAVELQDRGVLTDIFAVEYGLAPEHPYPYALSQLVAAYEHVRSLNKHIILMGDSAGGNLCLGLLRHINTPHPEICTLPSPTGENGAIVGLCLTSPWVNLRNDSDSFRQNSGKDCLDKAALDRWRQAYLCQQPVDLYSNPLDAIKGWSTLLPGQTFLLSGELDLFIADIRQLARTMTEDGTEGLELHVVPCKGHVWNMIDFGATLPGVKSSEAGKEKQSAYAGIVLQAEWIAKLCSV